MPLGICIRSYAAFREQCCSELTHAGAVSVSARYRKWPWEKRQPVTNIMHRGTARSLNDVQINQYSCAGSSLLTVGQCLISLRHAFTIQLLTFTTHPDMQQ